MVKIQAAGHHGESDIHTMRALVYEKYGAPEVLRIAEVEVPVPKAHEVLIAVYAASVNSWDWDLLRGKPFITRLGALRKPRYRILGADVAGRVVAVGEAVERFRPGDEVFGDISGSGWGGFAEYVCVSEEALTSKPAGISFEQAAAIPQAAVLALQGLRDKGQLRKGCRVLVNGAGGGVGTFAIQYAKWIGAEVSAVDHADKLDMMRSIGADHVLDYGSEDFASEGPRYDLILDVVGNRSVFEVKRALMPGGTYVMVGGTMSHILQAMLAAPLIAWLEKKKMTVLVHKPKHEDQLVWKELIEAGTVAPVIDRRYSLSEAAQAIQYLGEGRAKGKVIISMFK